VAAAAVILDPGDLPTGLNDSKKLSEARRIALETEIKARALAWSVGLASVEEIDRLNILQATGLAMRRAVEGLSMTPAFALVDGNYRFALPCPMEPLVKGDARSASIAAASILAKQARDRLMVEADVEWPGYGFAGHKGYHAPIHVEALKRLGPCPIHRKSFSPIRALIEQRALV
jgi:ribonuclease HII